MASDLRNQISSKNEGEGSKSAAKAYNKEQQDLVKSGKVPEAADKARRALDGDERDALRNAGAKGRAHAHGEDPALHKTVPKKP